MRGRQAFPAALERKYFSRLVAGLVRMALKHRHVVVYLFEVVVRDAAVVTVEGFLHCPVGAHIARQDKNPRLYAALGIEHVVAGRGNALRAAFRYAPST